jgi:type IV secretion system protein VirD4
MNRMNRRITRKSLLPRAAMTGAGLIGLGWAMHLMPEDTPGRVYWPWLLITGVLLMLGVVGVWRTRRRGSAGLVNRWARKGRRNHGLASPWAILRVASAFAMRRKVSVLRPGLRKLGWRRWLVPVRELATPLAGSGCCGCGRQSRT